MVGEELSMDFFYVRKVPKFFVTSRGYSWAAYRKVDEPDAIDRGVVGLDDAFWVAMGMYYGV